MFRWYLWTLERRILRATIIGIAAVSFVAGACTVASAQIQTQPIVENHEGKVTVRGNELIVESLVPDPSALRLGAPTDQRGLGKISFDILGGSRDEVVLIQGKQTEENNVLAGRGGEFYLGLKRAWAGSTDDAMVDALTVTVQDGFRFRLPISAPNLQFGQGSVVVGNWFIQSPQGKYRTYMQDDGNLVTYEVVQPGNWLCARWSIYTGPVVNAESQCQ